MISIAVFHLTQLNPCHLNALCAQASPERRARADSFRNRPDKIRCLVSEALARHVLGPDVVFEKGPWGKPCVRSRPELQFNLSHSGDWVVIAWGNSPVGIDVEVIRRDIAWEPLVRRYFSAREQAFVREADSLSRFFQVWTAKESYLKYLGTGLTRSLSGTDIFSLSFPGFYRFSLEGCCMTLCAEEPPNPPVFLTPNDLLQQ